MSRRAERIAVVVALALTAVASAGTPPDNFTLGRYVPDSCFVYYHQVLNPERALIKAQWDRVWASFSKAGVFDDLQNLIGEHLKDDERAEFEAFWIRTAELGGMVNWGDLAERELVVAGQMAPFPSGMVLCRGTRGSGPGNFAALAKLLKHLASVDRDACLVQYECGGNTVWSLSVPHLPVGLELFGQGDIIGLATSSQLSGQVGAMLAGQSKIRPIVDSPRFREGLASLPDPADLMMFFDWHLGMGGLHKLVQVAQSHTADSQAATEVLTFADRFLDRMDILDYTLSVQWTEGWREHSQSVTRLHPDGKSKRLARIKTGRKPLENPLALVPAEATACWASSGVDFGQLYDLIMDMLANDLPDGEQLLAEWQQVQEDIGFDVREDVLSWLSGELVTFQVRPAIVTPLRLVDWVVLVRVSDAELADQKIRSGLEWVKGPLVQYTKQPLILMPASSVRAEGFQSISVPIMAMFFRPIVGVHDRWLVIASSEEAINKYLATVAGDAPSFAESERYRTEAIHVAGPIESVSFTDLGGRSEEMAQAFAGMGVAAQMMPHNKETLPVMAMFRILASLQPVFSEIDFLSSNSIATTFDGSTWTTQSVINYIPAAAQQD